jgi:DNA-binding IclR family transcriptional regulator
VLEILARQGEAGVSEVAAELDVHRSTVHRILASLASGGLAEQVEERGRYRLGFGLVTLAGFAALQLDVVNVGRPVCSALAESLGETINVAVLDEGFAVNVDQALGPATVSTRNCIGKLTPLHCTSSGKVLLAGLSADERKAVLADSDFQRFTEQTRTPEALEDELAEVSANGYALALEEYEIGLNAAAAPVRDRDGRVTAALSVSGPSYRVDEPTLRSCTDALVAAAAEINHLLGYRQLSP